jgi:hypothetical protein
MCMRSMMVPESGGDALSQICERGLQARVLRLTGGADQPTEGGGGLLAKLRAMASSSKKYEDEGAENEKEGGDEEDINNIENLQKVNSKLGFEQAAQTSRFSPRRTLHALRPWSLSDAPAHFSRASSQHLTSLSLSLSLSLALSICGCVSSRQRSGVAPRHICVPRGVLLHARTTTCSRRRAPACAAR